MKHGDHHHRGSDSSVDKPLPALVIQQEVLEASENVTVALITSDLAWNPALQVAIQPTASNGLRKASEIMIDVIPTLPISRIGGSQERLTN